MSSGYPRGRRLLVSLFSLLLLCNGALAEDNPCTLHDNGKYYDLNPLKASKDYEIKTFSGKMLSLNVCQNVKTDMFGLKDDIQASDVGGFIRRGHGDFSLGKFNTTLSVLESRPRIVMSNGSRCKSKAGEQPGDIRASTLIEFVCDSSIFGPGTPRLVAELPPGDEETPCAFVIEWKSHYACPTSEGGGVWGFFGTLAVIFLVLLMAYTVLGTLYNRFVLDLRGYDQIPQFSIESMRYHGKEAYEWTRDMIGIIILNAGSRSGGAGDGYSGLSSGNAPNPVSHQAQVSGMTANSVEEGLGSAGFIRPQANRNRSAAFQRLETNPISHQSQVAQSLSFPASTAQTPQQSRPPPPQMADAPAPRRPGSDSRNSTKEEREFMLGDDDEDAEELGDIKTPLAQAEKSAEASNAPLISLATSTSAPASESSAAAARGRDLGDGETTLL